MHGVYFLKFVGKMFTFGVNSSKWDVSFLMSSQRPMHAEKFCNIADFCLATSYYCRRDDMSSLLRIQGR